MESNTGNKVRNPVDAEKWDKIEEALAEERRNVVDGWLGKIALQENLHDEKRSIQDRIKSRNRKIIEEKAEASPIATSIAELSDRDIVMREAIKKMQAENMLTAARLYSRISKDRRLAELLLSFATESHGKGEVSDRDENTDELREEIDEANKQLKDLPNTSRDAYFIMHGLELRENQKQLKNGDMVNTPYVEEYKQKLEKNMEAGTPTFIYGHLGSGKTELAISAATESAMKRAARQEALQDVEKYFENHSDELDDDSVYFDQLIRAYDRNYEVFRNNYRNGDKDTTERFVPLVILGGKDLTTQDLYTEKSLKLAHFNGKSLSEHKDEYDKEFVAWKEAHNKRYDNMSNAERAEHEGRDAREFFEMYKMKNQAFGTEVEVIMKELYRGITEGRPVIIDEANAIPAGVLISLNDVLQRQPGDSCYVPGVGSVKVQPGFSITMTGNPSTNEYAGTNDFNVAFASRLDKIKYGYLPQSTEGSFRERDPKKDELYRVMISYLADEKGNLQLPEIDKNVEKLYSLAQLAGLSQKIFAGENYSLGSGGDEKRIRFEKSVLSVRNILNVLKKWNKGAEMDLDSALYEGFITDMMDENEQNSMLQLAHDRYGFFAEQDGWKFVAKGPGENCTFKEDNAERLHSYQRRPLELYITAEVVDVIFGERPKREIYPNIDLDEMIEVSEEISDDKYAEIEQNKEMINQTIQALEVLAEQCGCNNTSSSEEA